MKIFINFSTFIHLCSAIFFLTTTVSCNKGDAAEKPLGESRQHPAEIRGTPPEGMVLIPAGKFEMGSNPEEARPLSAIAHARQHRFSLCKIYIPLNLYFNFGVAPQ